MSWLGSFFGTAGARPPAGTSNSATDIVTYLAALASNPKEIDPILDGLREVTGRHGADSSLTNEDQLALAEVYQKLLRYLVEQEPLRAFTREELEAKVRQQFKPLPNEAAFWQKVGL
jgi:hypothetical protein